MSGKEQKQRLADNAIKHMKKEKLAKIHLTEIEVVTGEEGERNVLQVMPFCLTLSEFEMP